MMGHGKFKFLTHPDLIAIPFMSGILCISHASRRLIMKYVFSTMKGALSDTSSSDKCAWYSESVLLLYSN